ncbi:uncharacterized protein LOC116954097 [Petromyzon marinus]|uniref:uncharacterized protein LOC116954097 n=1 Tax=Petromyzon marinus TaxID=7757 RepID=UPI003F72A7DA
MAGEGSQCLDEQWSSQQWLAAKREAEETYVEVQREAVEALLRSGRAAYDDFVLKERLRGFLGEGEIEELLRWAVAPPAAADDDAEDAERTQHEREDGAVRAEREGSLASTYFPEQSDVETPMLELGWPCYKGQYRGVSRAEVYLQPYVGEGAGSCRDGVRKLARGAQSLIALVMDAFTDVEIFRDLVEASVKKRVPVYILLEPLGVPDFLLMSERAGHSLSQLKNVRVRTVPGLTYYTRFGVKVTGQLREKYMLVDGCRVGIGSYSYTWSDFKLHRSTLAVLSGQITEVYDNDFRILYALSQPLCVPGVGAVPTPSRPPGKLQHALGERCETAPGQESIRSPVSPGRAAEVRPGADDDDPVATWCRRHAAEPPPPITPGAAAADAATQTEEATVEERPSDRRKSFLAPHKRPLQPITPPQQPVTSAKNVAPGRRSMVSGGPGVSRRTSMGPGKRQKDGGVTPGPQQHGTAGAVVARRRSLTQKRRRSDTPAPDKRRAVNGASPEEQPCNEDGQEAGNQMEVRQVGAAQEPRPVPVKVGGENSAGGIGELQNGQVALARGAGGTELQQYLGQLRVERQVHYDKLRMKVDGLLVGISRRPIANWIKAHQAATGHSSARQQQQQRREAPPGAVTRSAGVHRDVLPGAFTRRAREKSKENRKLPIGPLTHSGRPISRTGL